MAATVIQMPRTNAATEHTTLVSKLASMVIGQPNAVSAIVPYIHMHRARISPEGRPAGVFLLLGPTGTGKTRTVEAVAQVLHDDPKRMIKIDCGEYQMDHEVAKLIGAPPGYLGHKETPPALSQQKVTAAASTNSNVSVVLFDEIEKAAESMTRVLLGIMDKATLRTGDNQTTNFENSLIFLTSNLGASEMAKILRPDFGLATYAAKQDAHAPESESIGAKLKRITGAAMKRKFSPEFCNRIDSVITFVPLTATDLAAILELELHAMQDQMDRRFDGQLHLEVRSSAKRLLLQWGTSPEYGARELKRALHRHILRPLADLLNSGSSEGTVVITANKSDDGLRLRMQ